MNLVFLLFSFRGRINRAQYWLGNLIAGIGGGVAIFAIVLATSASAVVDAKKANMLATMGSMLLADAPVLLAMLWCGFAITVKRFHDRGRSGWLALAPLPIGALILSNIVGGIATNAPAAHFATSVPLMLLAQLINLAFLIDLGCLGSKPGPNKHGDPPGLGPARPTAPPKPNAKAQASDLLGAQSAIEAAIAARKSGQPAPALARTAAPPANAPARADAPATPSFGRRTAR